MINCSEKGWKKRIYCEAVKSSFVTMLLRLKQCSILERLEDYFERHRVAALITAVGRLTSEEVQLPEGDTLSCVNQPLKYQGLGLFGVPARGFRLQKLKSLSEANMIFRCLCVCRRLYGGGGHIMAGRWRIHGTLDECRRFL